MRDTIQITDAMVDAGCKAIIDLRDHGKWPEDFNLADQSIGRQNIRVALEAALSAAEPEPVAWYWEDKSGCYHITMDRPDVQEMAAEFFCDPKPLYDHPSQPAPSVAVKAAKTTCKNCGSDLNSWFTSNRVNSVAVDGRLKSNEISCNFVLGCDECSETLRVVAADEIASQINAALSAQVQDVARLETIVKAAQAYVDAVSGEPEKDCWDTEDGKEAPGAEKFASDWAWKAYDDAKQKAFDNLCAALPLAWPFWRADG